VGIVKADGKILADEKAVYTPPIGRGIIPREAADRHYQMASRILTAALSQARLNMEDVGLISVALGPGLPPCLRVGATLARYLSGRYKKPLIGVNHCVGHIEIARLTTGCGDPVILYLSGGNSQVISFVEGRYRIFGETDSIPIGNALDMLARELGLPMPGGPHIEKLAQKGSYVKLPYVVKGMDFSFTGITTEAVRKFRRGVSREDICYSFQETCFAMLTEVTERAVAHTGKEEVLLTGGVAANKRLQQMLRRMCRERGARFYVVPPNYSGDCGAMIAWTGILAYSTGQVTPLKESFIRPHWRTDQPDITWLGSFQCEKVKYSK
jgi:universal protein Kae1